MDTKIAVIMGANLVGSLAGSAVFGLSARALGASDGAALVAGFVGALVGSYFAIAAVIK